MRSVSIIIPTLNAEKVLSQCLDSIKGQDYPADKIEIIIADAASTDRTLEIVRCYTDKIYRNELQTAEAGKALGLKHASHEIIALIDSDNVLPCSDWLARMTVPFADAEIAGAEPLEYTYRRQDRCLNRYWALLGMNDPLCLFLGNYDRYSTLTQRWTQAPVYSEDKGDYLKVTLDRQPLPTMGANGFLIRRELLQRCAVQDYLFDVDLIQELTARQINKFAKVKVGIVHLFSEDIATFIRKQRRRLRDYLYYSRQGLRRYRWDQVSRKGILKFILYCLLVLPLVGQSVVGYTRKPDPAWFFHPLACWLTLGIYTVGSLQAVFSTSRQNRDDWRQ
ncbi:MAG: glycosyltransferase family 2 protein [Chloroflexi bacterium]|nr:glycosyltransferase family 2 protein [Chloroflexota bacterium]